jgi:hypothetical protein
MQKSFMVGRVTGLAWAGQAPTVARCCELSRRNSSGDARGRALSMCFSCSACRRSVCSIHCDASSGGDAVDAVGFTFASSVTFSCRATSRPVLRLGTIVAAWAFDFTTSVAFQPAKQRSKSTWSFRGQLWAFSFAWTPSSAGQPLLHSNRVPVAVYCRHASNRVVPLVSSGVTSE